MIPDIKKVYELAQHKNDNVVIDIKTYGPEQDTLIYELHSGDDKNTAEDILGWLYRNRSRYHGREVFLMPHIMEGIVRCIGMVRYHNTKHDENLPIAFQNHENLLTVFGFRLKEYGQDTNRYYKPLKDITKIIRGEKKHEQILIAN